METIVINQIKDQSYTMKESLRALKTSISFSGKGVKSILFTSSVPNEAKSLAEKADRTSEEDDMLDMMLHGGERVKAENLSAVLDWYRVQR